MKKRSTILIALGAMVFTFAGASVAGADAQARGQLSAEESTWLVSHNQARAEFGAAPLQWSDDLTREARQWAHQLARENTIRHSSQNVRGNTGENLWMGTSGYYPAASMVGFFVDEKRYFRAGRFPNVSATGNWADVGHYTQIVWAETREVGCAKASNGHNDVLVCRYYPGGNVLGEYIAPGRRVARR